MDTSTLKTAYGALRDFLAEQRLYDDAPTGAFDRVQLARLFTAYYDAEAETLRGVSGAQTGAALDDVARSIGYDDYAQMADGEKIIEGGKVRPEMVDGMQQLTDNVHEMNYLKDAFSRDATEIENGIVLSSFIGVRDQGRISAGISSGYVNHTEVPLIFAGADSVLSALKTASYCLSRDGVHKTRNQKRTEVVNISNGNISFATVSNGSEKEVMSMAPTVYAPSTGKTVFGNTQLIGEPSGQQTVECPNWSAKPDMPLENGLCDLYYGVLGPYYDDDPPVFSGLGDMSDKFEVGNNATITVSGITFRQGAEIYYYMPLPNGDPDREWVNFVYSTACQTIFIYLQNIATGQRYTIFQGFGKGSEIQIPTWSISKLPKGVYKIAFECSATFEFSPVESNYGFMDNGSISWTKFTAHTSWSGGVYNSKVFGNGWLYSQMNNCYCGVIGDSSNFALEQRSNRNGFRADGGGQWRWSNKLQEWIPADGVLYRAYDPNNGTLTPKQWSYNGSRLKFKFVKEGSLWIDFPKAFTSVSDYFVRVDQVVMLWRDVPTIFVGGNLNSGFQMNTCAGGFHWHGFMLEVLYTGDWW